MSRYIGDKEVADFLIKEEGFLDKPTDIGDGKITLGSGLTDPKWHTLYRKKGKWSKEDNRNAVLEEVAKRRVWAEDTIPNWEQLPESAQDALLSYKYNYNFTPTNSPNLFEAMRERNFFKAAEEINATSKDPKFRKGLEERRKKEQEMFLSDLMPQKTSSHSVYVPYTNNVVSDNTRVVRYPTREESTQFRTIVPERNYVETTTISPGEQRAQQLRNTFESTRDYNRMMQNISIQNNPQPTFTPQYNYHSDGGSLNTPKLWDNLSLTEKSDMMRVAIENGITTLPEIREAYNEFAEGGGVDSINTYETGGYKPSESIKSRIAQYEGKAMTGARDPISGKWGKNSSFEAEARGFYKALPVSIREQVLSNPELADSLYSYSYNVGAGNFKKRVVPALERYYAGIGSVKDIEDSMWATHDNKLRGLQRRRAEEKAGVRNALMGEAMPLLYTEQAIPEFTPFNPQAFSAFMGVDGNYEDYIAPQVVDVEEPLVQAAMESAYSPEQIEREERAQGLRNLGLAMSIMRGGQSPAESSSLWNTVGLLTGSQYKNGGKIHIKPENRGKFTALKKRTGHSATWFKEHGTPAQKKMATFALNSRHWKHGLGGNLFSGEDESTQQMQNGLNLYRRTNNLGETEYIYQETPDSEEILLTPTNKRFSDDPTNWDYKDASGRKYSPRMTTTYNPGEIREDTRGPLERMVDNYFGELKYQVNNNVPISGEYTMPAIAAAPFLAWAGEAAYPYVSAALANPYVDAGLTSAFAGHGLNHAINEGIDGWGDAAMTALEIAPLGRLARPIYEGVVQPGMRLFNSPLTGNWTKIGNREYRFKPGHLGMNGAPVESREATVIVQELPIGENRYYRAFDEHALDSYRDLGVISQFNKNGFSNSRFDVPHFSKGAPLKTRLQDPTSIWAVSKPNANLVWESKRGSGASYYYTPTVNGEYNAAPISEFDFYRALPNDKGYIKLTSDLNVPEGINLSSTPHIDYLNSLNEQQQIEYLTDNGLNSQWLWTLKNRPDHLESALSKAHIPDVARTPEITAENAASMTPVPKNSSIRYAGSAKEDYSNSGYRVLDYLRENKINAFLQGKPFYEMDLGPLGIQRENFPSDWTMTKMPFSDEAKDIINNSAKPRILAQAEKDIRDLYDPTIDGPDIEKYVKNELSYIEKQLDAKINEGYELGSDALFKAFDEGKTATRTGGLQLTSDGKIVLREGENPEEFAVHEWEHRRTNGNIGGAHFGNEKRLLRKAFTKEFRELSETVPDFKGMNMDDEMVTTVSDAREALMGKTHLRKTAPELQNKMIDKSSDEKIFEAVEKANAYGSFYIKKMRELGKLTPKLAQNIREALKHVGGYAIPTAIAAGTLYGKQE